MENRQGKEKTKKVMVFILVLSAIVVFSNPIAQPIKIKKTAVYLLPAKCGESMRAGN